MLLRVLNSKYIENGRRNLIEHAIVYIHASYYTALFIEHTQKIAQGQKEQTGTISKRKKRSQTFNDNNISFRDITSVSNDNNVEISCVCKSKGVT